VDVYCDGFVNISSLLKSIRLEFLPFQNHLPNKMIEIRMLEEKDMASKKAKKVIKGAKKDIKSAKKDIKKAKKAIKKAKK